MTRKTPVYNFEQFSGKDVTRSHLSRAPESAVEFDNLVKLHNGSVKGRPGLSLIGQPLAFRRLFTHLYTDENGDEQSELLAFATEDANTPAYNHCLFRLSTSKLTIAYSGANPWSYLIETDTANNRLVFNMTENSVLRVVQSLGDGYGASPYTLQQLAAEITAITNFSASVDKTAVVDADQSGVTTIDVDSGHTIDVGDFAFFQDGSFTPDFFSCKYREVIATTATTLELRVNLSETFDVYDNEVIGHGRFPAAILPPTGDASITGAASTEIEFEYWEPVPIYTVANPLRDAFKKGVSKKFGHYTKTLPTAINHRNCVYFSHRDATSLDLVKYGPDIEDRVDFKAGVWKYDGKKCFLSGGVNVSPVNGSFSTFFSLAQSSTGTALPAGDYVYQISFLHKDSRRNIVESFLTHTFEHTQSATKDVDVSLDSIVGGRDVIEHRNFDIRDANLTSAATNATTLNITSGHDLRTGDYIYAVNTTGELLSLKVTAWTKTSITVDQSVSIANGNKVSTTALRLWRTKENGNLYYLAKQVPVGFDVSTTFTLVDDTTDANLGISKPSVEPSDVQYNLPPCNSLTTQESVMVACGAGDDNSRSTVYWENPDSIETSPRSTNNYVTSSESRDEIFAAVSASRSSLVLAKEYRRDELLGSLASNAVELNKLSDNSYGVKSPMAMITLAKEIIGAGPLGLFSDTGRGVGAPILSYFRDKVGVRPEFASTSDLLPPKDSAFRHILHYDPDNNWLHLFIPVEELLTGGDKEYNPTTTSRHLVFIPPDLPEDIGCWAEFKYSSVYQVPSAGFANYNGRLYMASVYKDTDTWVGYCHRQRVDEIDGEQEYDYLDHVYTYDYSFIPQWENGEDPQSEKFWHEFVLYQLQPDDFFESFTAEFVSYRDWNLSNTDTVRSSTLAFPTSSVSEKTLQFDKQYRAKRRTFKIHGTINKNPPVFTGYGYTYDERVYDKNRQAPE